MKVMGIEIVGSDIVWVLLEGSQKQFTISRMDPNRFPLPAAHSEEVDKLLGLQSMLQGQFSTIKIDRIGIVKAMQDSSAIRAKVECVVQFAAKAIGIDCALFAPQTVRAAQDRKIKSIAGEGGHEQVDTLEPKYLRKAAACAWCAFDGN